jgi:hypothetical protein
MAFVKVVEGSEVYKFPIHHLEHFYTIFLSLTRSKPGIATQSRAGQNRAAPTPPPRLHPAVSASVMRAVREGLDGD